MATVDLAGTGPGLVVALVVGLAGCAPHDKPDKLDEAAEGAAAAREVSQDPYPGPRVIGACDPLQVLPEYEGKRTIEIEFLGQAPSGNIVMATHPRPPANVMSSEGLRVFFGPPGAVEERRVGGFGTDDQGLFFNFFLEAGSAAVRVTSKSRCHATGSCEGFIKRDRGKAKLIPVTRDLAELTFTCRSWWTER